MTTTRASLPTFALAAFLATACTDGRIDDEATLVSVDGREERIEPTRPVSHPVRAGEIVFASRDGDRGHHIHVVRADGTRKVLTSGTGEEIEPQWSPDGTRIAFVGLVRRPGRDAEPKADIYVINRDGTGERRLTDGPGTKRDPSWSPDGTRIAFAASDRTSGSWYIAVARAVGQDSTALSKPPDGCRDREPAWSPDGLSVAFARTCGGAPSKLYVTSIDGMHMKVLSEVGRTPEWSPDGSAIAYTGLGTEGPAVFVMYPDGGRNRQLTRAVSGDPSWSPDGTEIVFARAALSAHDLYIIKLDGGQVRRLTMDGHSFTASWGVGSPSPAGASLTSPPPWMP